MAIYMNVGGESIDIKYTLRHNKQVLANSIDYGIAPTGSGEVLSLSTSRELAPYLTIGEHTMDLSLYARLTGVGSFPLRPQVFEVMFYYVEAPLVTIQSVPADASVYIDGTVIPPD